MNTIALDNKTYSNVELYARQNNISVTEAVIYFHFHSFVNIITFSTIGPIS